MRWSGSPDASADREGPQENSSPSTPNPQDRILQVCTRLESEAVTSGSLWAVWPVNRLHRITGPSSWFHLLFLTAAGQQRTLRHLKGTPRSPLPHGPEASTQRPPRPSRRGRACDMMTLMEMGYH
ncbi:unnamed protein product [Gadus morhua 'NCC']